MPEDDQQGFWANPLSGITGFVADTLGLGQQQKKQIKPVTKNRDKEESKYKRDTRNEDDKEDIQQLNIGNQINEGIATANKYIEDYGGKPVVNYISQNIIEPTGKYLKDSTLGQTADFLIGRPYRAIKGFTQPIQDVYNGTMKIARGLDAVQNSGYMGGWDATKKVAGGIKDVVGGYMGLVPATFNLATGIIPTLAAGKLGYQIVKSGRQSDINNRLKQRRQRRKNFLSKGNDVVNNMKTQYVWQKIRNRNLQSKLEQKRLKDDGKNTNPIFINVQTQGNPKAKDMASIDKKQIIRAQQQYKDLKKHI